MAEKFVSDIASSLLHTLVSKACKEISRACGVYDDLQKLKDTLSIVIGLLLDAEKKKDKPLGLTEWLRQIQSICFEFEDLLDEFEVQDKRKQVVEASGKKWMKVRNFFSSSNSLVFRYRMAHQIQEIKDKLDKVAVDGTKFGLVRIEADSEQIVQRGEMTHSYLDASTVIGRENDREQIVKLLMQPHPHPNVDADSDKSLCVIPIVGIGGLGKTSLAKSVFNDKRMDELFQLKIWVCVSINDFDIKQIIIKIVNSASAASTFASASAPIVAHAHHENLNNLDIEQLQIRLRHTLSGQRFLLVLDDIWNDDRAKWTELEDLIKVGSKGSKVIVTTRSNSIASMMGTVPSYVLKGISLENCLSLFVKWAFKQGEEVNYPNLVEIGNEIVKKCQGVPLAVKTLGSSLFSKHDLSKWIFVRDSELWNLEQKRDDILPALKLSYDQMPSHLRQCFAYFSLYPKDYTFNGIEICMLWVALGLVQSENESEKLEDVAREYIEELNSKSFLQDFVDVDYNYYFKVHDLVHDLALYVAKNDFAVVNLHTRIIPEQSRHLSVVENVSLGHVLFPNSKSVRTILILTKGVGDLSETLLETWISKYKYLRYLDLSDSSLETIPNSIAKLKHLRALDLANNSLIHNLPDSICELYNLRALLLNGCTNLIALPKGLRKLISLRQRYITTQQSTLSENDFASFKHLHTLGFHDCHNLKFLFNKAQLPSLETLLVMSCESLESFPFHIFAKLHTLILSDCRKLKIVSIDKSPVPRLRMKFLLLDGFQDLLLPSWIHHVVDTLETLVIINFPRLDFISEDLTKLPHLKRLCIRNCPYMPETYVKYIHRLTSLEHLLIDGCPELCRKCTPQIGEYWPLIAHIKHVFIGEPRGGDA